MLNTLGAEGWEAVTSLGSREKAPTLFSKNQFQSSPLPAASVALLNPPQVRPAARFVTIIQTKNSRHKSRESQGNRGPQAPEFKNPLDHRGMGAEFSGSGAV